MSRAWRIELLCVAVIALALMLVGHLAGDLRLLLGLGLLGYLAWHLVNFLLLQIWIHRRRSFRLPISVGVWEAVFDGLQREQMRRRRRGRQLLAGLSNYREAADTLPDAIVVLSESGAIRWFNPAAGRLLGLRSKIDLGQDIRRFVKHPILDDDLAEGRSSRPLEVPSPANGAWMLSLQVTASFGDQNDRLLVARDITASFRLEEARRDFLASASHELRTPITVFRGYLEALQEAAADNLTWRKPVAQMDQQARHMQALVDDLLELSRLEMADRPLAQAPVSVPEMLAEIVTEAYALCGQPIHDLRLEAEAGLWLIGDASELRSAFSNLIFNAVRHTPAGTRVEITWSGDAEGAHFTVRDQGPGIAAQHLPRLTDRFYRVEAGRSRQAGGSGLGLAIAKQVLERYSADLRISSELGQGTTFACHFPQSLVRIEPATALSKAG